MKDLSVLHSLHDRPAKVSVRCVAQRTSKAGTLRLSPKVPGNSTSLLDTSLPTARP